jgi:predicted Zn-dependent peptidase
MEINSELLENKLRFITISDNDANSVSLMILVKAGSRYETDKISGLAHFVEHNFFKGTKSLPSSKAIGMAIEKLGGSSNAFTSYEYTGYYIKVPKENWKKAMAILADMIKNSVFPKQEVEKERGVVIEEIRMYEDISMRKVSQDFMTNLFGAKHPLGNDIAGDVKSVSSLSRKDILAFTDSFYTGANMLISIAGGIEFDEVVKEVKELFEDIDKGKEQPFEKYADKEIKSKKYIRTKKLEQTHIVIGGFGLPRGSEKRYALKLGLSILAKGFGSKLFQTIREELGLAYYINASHQGFNEVGAWDISLGVDNNRADEAVNAVLKVVNDFKKGKFNDEEMERGRNLMLGNLITQLESSDDIAIWHGIQQLLLGYVETVEQVKKKIMKVTKEEIMGAWDNLLSNDNMMLTAITPLDDIKSDI